MYKRRFHVKFVGTPRKKQRYCIVQGGSCIQYFQKKLPFADAL